MTKSLMGACALFLLSLAAQAAEVQVREDHPGIYHVERGDTLWDIADAFLKSPWRWPEIWHKNPQVDNPHLIYPGDTIKLEYVEGEPRLSVSRGKRGRTVKLHPQARPQPLETAIPSVPRRHIQPFLEKTQVVTGKQLKQAPYVVAGQEAHIALGAGDTFYARGQLQSDETTYGIFREGEPYVDPMTGEVLGYQAKRLGLTKIEAVEDDIATVRITQSREEIGEGDRLLPTQEQNLETVFHPQRPDEAISGRVIRLFGTLGHASQFDVVVLNRGARDGLESSHVLAVYKKGRVVRDFKTLEKLRLPQKRAGIMLVFRVFEKVSYALILEASRPVDTLDVIRRP